MQGNKTISSSCDKDNQVFWMKSMPLAGMGNIDTAVGRCFCIYRCIHFRSMCLRCLLMWHAAHSPMPLTFDLDWIKQRISVLNSARWPRAKQHKHVCYKNCGAQSKYVAEFFLFAHSFLWFIQQGWGKINFGGECWDITVLSRGTPSKFLFRKLRATLHVFNPLTGCNLRCKWNIGRWQLTASILD